MRYGYKYHDHQGNIKIGEIESPTREEAFQALKGSGVKPMQFWTIEEPPSKRRFSVRWVLIALLSVALCFALYLLLVGGEGTSRTPAQSGAMAAGRTAMPRARRQGVLAHAEADRPLAQMAFAGDAVGVAEGQHAGSGFVDRCVLFTHTGEDVRAEASDVGVVVRRKRRQSPQEEQSGHHKGNGFHVNCARL